MKLHLSKDRLIYPLLLAALLLALVEIGAYFSLKFIEFEFERINASGNLIGDARPYTQQEIADYYRQRDPELGWPTSNILNSPRHDAFDARPDPGLPNPQVFCGAAFGDSFTYSAEVDDQFAWSHRLSEMLGCRVANFGVGAYGTDQAYLRFKSTDLGAAELVILGIYPDNVMRNVNQYRGFLVGRHNISSFKPRFVVENGKLVEVPLVDRLDVPLNRLLDRPERYLTREFFLPDTTYGPVRIEFPYTLSALRALFHPRAMAILKGEPSWVDFYRPEHESRALEVTTAIIDHFVRDVKQLDKIPLVYLFTNTKSVGTFQRTGTWPYASLLDYMNSNAIPYVHLGEEVGEFMDLEDICDIFTTRSLFGCTGHHTPVGYEYVAKSIYSYLEEHDIQLGGRRAASESVADPGSVQTVQF